MALNDLFKIRRKKIISDFFKVENRSCAFIWYFSVGARTDAVVKKVLNKWKYKRGLRTYVIGKSACRPYNFR